MITSILTIIQLILVHIAFDTIVTRFLLCGFFCLFFVYYFSKRKAQIKITDLGINSWADIIPFVCWFFTLYLGVLMYMRFCNIGHTIDLKDRALTVKSFIESHSWGYIVITCMFYIFVILLVFLFFRFLSKSIKFNLLKIHLYIISLEKESYKVFCNKLFKFYIKLTGIFSSLADFIHKLITIYILKKPYNKYNFHAPKPILFIVSIRHYNALIILLILVLYDVIINDFVITKIYYFLPIAFFYNLIILLVYVTTKFGDYDDTAMACFLYMEFITPDNNDFYIFDNNFAITKIELEQIESKLTSIFA